MNINKNVWPEFHQVAIYVPESGHRAAVDMIAAFEPEAEWSEDWATLRGEVWAVDHFEPSEIKGHMSFNYRLLGGREFEIVSYTGNSHHDYRGTTTANPTGFISHMSTHSEDAEGLGAELCSKFDLRVVHRFETFDHVNPHVAGKKRFKEVVLGTRHLLGFDVKIIQRLSA